MDYDYSTGYYAQPREGYCDAQDAAECKVLPVTREVFEAIRNANWEEEQPTDEDVWGVLEGHLFLFEQDAYKWIASRD